MQYVSCRIIRLNLLPLLPLTLISLGGTANPRSMRFQFRLHKPGKIDRGRHEKGKTGFSPCYFTSLPILEDENFVDLRPWTDQTPITVADIYPMDMVIDLFRKSKFFVLRWRFPCRCFTGFVRCFGTQPPPPIAFYLVVLYLILKLRKLTWFGAKKNNLYSGPSLCHCDKSWSTCGLDHQERRPTTHQLNEASGNGCEPSETDRAKKIPQCRSFGKSHWMIKKN